MEKVLGYRQQALDLGARMHCGDEPLDLSDEQKGGYFMRPCVFTGLDHACAPIQEEIFGPVVFVVPFGDEKEAVTLANDVKYGLSASVWTRDSARVHRVSQRLHAGVVWANCWLVRDLRTPFGGWKNSGVGREGQEDSVDFFTEVKNICVAYGE